MKISCFEWVKMRPGLFLGAALLLTGSPSEAVDLAVSGIEVTQAIQNYTVSNPSDPANNSNVLVAGNNTVARVYLAVTNSPGSVAGVTALLSVWVNGVLDTVIPPNGPGFIAAPLVPDPGNEGHSLNFTLPIDFADNDIVDLVVEVDPYGSVAEDDEGNNEFELNGLEFKCRKTPEIVFIPINYTSANESDPLTIGLPDPSLIAPGAGDDFIFGIFPFPDDRSQYHSAPLLPLTWSQNIDISDSQLINVLESCRQAINPVPKFLYAWFRENPYYGNGLSGGIPGNVAFGNTQTTPNRYLRTFAHELGHLFGMFHNSRDIAPNTGWDVEDLLGFGHAMPGSKFDIMVAALNTPEAWIDDTTYEHLLDHGGLACSADTQKFLSKAYFATAVVFPVPGGGLLDPSFQFLRNITPSVSVPQSAVKFQALDADGRVLQEIGVIPNFENEAGEAVGSAAISVTFSDEIDSADIASIQLVEGGSVSDRLLRSANAPQVSVQSPRRGQTLDGPFDVSWEASDQDDDELTYIVQYSWGFDREGRQLWVPLAVNQKTTRVSSDTSYLAASDNGTIRVIASDGLNTTVAEIRGLYVPGENPPELAITQRNQSGDYLEGSLVILQASAFDREDGLLPGGSLQWASDLDGRLGTGPTLQVADLSPGIHVITVTARDSGGALSEDKMEINILPNHDARALRAARAAQTNRQK